MHRWSTGRPRLDPPESARYHILWCDHRQMPPHLVVFGLTRGPSDPRFRGLRPRSPTPSYRPVRRPTRWANAGIGIDDAEAIEGGLATTRDETPDGARRADGVRRNKERWPGPRPSPPSAPARPRILPASRQGGPRPDLRAALDAPGVHPYDEITWELRSAEIKNESGKSVFEQHDIEVPPSGASWRPTSWSASTSAAISAPRARALASSSSSTASSTPSPPGPQTQHYFAPRRTWPPSRRS